MAGGERLCDVDADGPFGAFSSIYAPLLKHFSGDISRDDNRNIYDLI